MKNILIFSVFNDFNALELAIENYNAGNIVWLLQCDRSQSICQHNKFGNPIMCWYCRHSMTNVIGRQELNKKVNLLYMSNILTEDDKHAANSFNYSFNSVSELKGLKYHNAEVGYGAFSSYVTFSRNVMPDMTPEFKKYISCLVSHEIEVYHALERLNDNIQFDQIILHNGRFAQFKPFLEFAKLHSIDYICTEHRRQGDKLLKDLFYNDIPHSIYYVSNNVLKNWEKGDRKDRDAIGRDFFERRKKGIPAGDKVYIKDQKVGEMPKEWDDDVENITIFNSSEDEFCAVSKEYDSYLMFPNQYVALQTIFEHYKNDKTKHFYLRIHPNLKNVPFKSHKILYKLKYENVTIIPADSSISSYALLDRCDKVLIFDSTMGVEATYAGKPVIALTRYFYTILDMVYTPVNTDTLWQLLDSKGLPSKMNENVIKYGYWLMHQNYPEVSQIPYKHVNFWFLGRQFNTYTIMKFLGSHKLNVLMEFLMDNIRVLSKFKKLPSTEPYKG